MGGPSEYAKSMSKVMLFILMLQTVACGLRLFLILDIMGGFMMAIGIGLGWYAWKENMHITFIFYWGFFSLFNGAFDLVKLIDFAVKSPVPLFSSQLPTEYNVASAVQLSIPLSVLLGCPLAWYLYKDATDSPSDASMMSQGSMGRNGVSESTSMLARPQQPTFTTFSGSGNRLGHV